MINCSKCNSEFGDYDLICGDKNECVNCFDWSQMYHYEAY